MLYKASSKTYSSLFCRFIQLFRLTIGMNNLQAVSLSIDVTWKSRWKINSIGFELKIIYNAGACFPLLVPLG